MYVFDGARNEVAWRETGWNGSHAALWFELSLLLRAKPPGHVLFTKVQGHATNDQVRRGVVIQLDKDGNDAADSLATLAAASHAAPADLRHRAACREAMTRATQTMMLKIMERRRAAEQQLGVNAPDVQESDSDDDEHVPSGPLGSPGGAAPS